MHSIRTKFTLTVVSVIIITLCVATAIGVVSIKKLGSEDADQMLHLTATTGALNLEQYFESVENSVRTVSTLVSDSFDGMPFEDLSIRFGIFTNAGQETDMEERFERARIAADRVKNDTETICGFYDLR